jgi:hypothetical protein
MALMKPFVFSLPHVISGYVMRWSSYCTYFVVFSLVSKDLLSIVKHYSEYTKIMGSLGFTPNQFSHYHDSLSSMYVSYTLHLTKVTQKTRNIYSHTLTEEYNDELNTINYVF